MKLSEGEGFLDQVACLKSNKFRICRNYLCIKMKSRNDSVIKGRLVKNNLPLMGKTEIIGFIWTDSTMVSQRHISNRWILQ
jgi:hypothetical protein